MTRIILAAIAASMIGLTAAHAQAQRAPVVREPEPAARASPAPAKLPVLPAWQPGAPMVLKIPNPLGLPDPLCVTDHPSASCPAAITAAGGGSTLTGDPIKDLTMLFQQGGKAFIRDMGRADQYASYQAVPACVSTAAAPCAKTDPIASACLEALIPLAELVINGPPATTTPPADPALADLAASDEALITLGEKGRIIATAIQGPTITAGCGGLVVDSVKQVTSLAAGIVTFITTLGVAG